MIVVRPSDQRGQFDRGELTLNGQPLRAGDGDALSGEATVTVQANGDPAEVMLFDLA